MMKTFLYLVRRIHPLSHHMYLCLYREKLRKTAMVCTSDGENRVNMPSQLFTPILPYHSFPVTFSILLQVMKDTYTTAAAAVGSDRLHCMLHCNAAGFRSRKWRWTSWSVPNQMRKLLLLDAITNTRIRILDLWTSIHTDLKLKRRYIANVKRVRTTPTVVESTNQLVLCMYSAIYLDN